MLCEEVTMQCEEVTMLCEKVTNAMRFYGEEGAMWWKG